MNDSDRPANPYPPSAERLEDKPGYPFNTARGTPKVHGDTGQALSDSAQLGSFIPANQPIRPGLTPDGKEPFIPQTGQNSARRMLESLAGDEPVFCLLGRDISAAMFVRSWIALQELNPNPPWAKIRKARQILAQFEQYHRDGKTKWPY